MSSLTATSMNLLNKTNILMTFNHQSAQLLQTMNSIGSETRNPNQLGHSREISTLTYNTNKMKREKEEGNINLRVVTDSSFHRPTSIVMLDSKPNIRNQSAIIFWNCTLNLQNQHHKDPKKKTKYEGRIYGMSRQKTITLISLKGIKRLFSSLESSPRMRAAWRKLRLVAARAFMGA